MLPVAELLEHCFDIRENNEAANLIREMRWAAKLGVILNLAVLAGQAVFNKMGGLVWTEGGRVVGYLSLSKVENVSIIANVSVNSKYRRRGIATSLISAALRKVKGTEGNTTWLQVKEENKGAIKLYKAMGFTTQKSIQRWLAPPLFSPPLSPFVRPWRETDWPTKAIAEKQLS
ncbi:MAG: GNAT family N-acetyltransferase [Anaerolineales bacterium]